MSKYAIGIDYGTLSVRALLVNIETGEEVAASIYEYPHGVMEEHIPSGKKLPVGWALQDPQDYLEGLLVTVRDVVSRINSSGGSCRYWSGFYFFYGNSGESRQNTAMSSSRI